MILTGADTFLNQVRSPTKQDMEVMANQTPKVLVEVGGGFMLPTKASLWTDK